MNWEASEIVEQESDKFKRWIQIKHFYYEQGRQSLSAFSHMNTSDLRPQQRWLTVIETVSIIKTFLSFVFRTFKYILTLLA